MKYIRYILFLFMSVSFCQVAIKDKMHLMGSNFEITVVAEDSAQGMSFISSAVNEISRIENLISSWDLRSQTSKINNYAGIRPVKVDKELFDLIERTIRISEITDGAFDISFAAMDSIWRFDGTMIELPSESIISYSLDKVGYKNIILDKDNSTIFLKLKGMKIGFGGIGKGYAADKAKELLINKGVQSGIINASGDINTWGLQPNGEEWKVAITNPLNKKNAFALLPVRNKAVVTSGDYEKFIIIGGNRYSHIIDPRTGYPSKGIISSTIFAKNAELADALATSIIVMGKDAGINIIDQIPQVECMLIDDRGEIHYSKNIQLELQ